MHTLHAITSQAYDADLARQMVVHEHGAQHQALHLCEPGQTTQTSQVSCRMRLQFEQRLDVCHSPRFGVLATR